MNGVSGPYAKEILGNLLGKLLGQNTKKIQNAAVII